MRTETWNDRRHRQRIDRAAKRAERERIANLRRYVEAQMRLEARREAANADAAQ